MLTCASDQITLNTEIPLEIEQQCLSWPLTAHHGQLTLRWIKGITFRTFDEQNRLTITGNINSFSLAIADLSCQASIKNYQKERNTAVFSKWKNNVASNFSVVLSKFFLIVTPVCFTKVIFSSFLSVIIRAKRDFRFLLNDLWTWWIRAETQIKDYIHASI